MLSFIMGIKGAADLTDILVQPLREDSSLLHYASVLVDGRCRTDCKGSGSKFADVLFRGKRLSWHIQLLCCEGHCLSHSMD